MDLLMSNVSVSHPHLLTLWLSTDHICISDLRLLPQDLRSHPAHVPAAGRKAWGDGTPLPLPLIGLSHSQVWSVPQLPCTSVADSEMRVYLNFPTGQHTRLAVCSLAPSTAPGSSAVIPG